MDFFKEVEERLAKAKAKKLDQVQNIDIQLAKLGEAIKNKNRSDMLEYGCNVLEMAVDAYGTEKAKEDLKNIAGYYLQKYANKK